jgi:hypothetical protein
MNNIGCYQYVKIRRYAWGRWVILVLWSRPSEQVCAISSETSSCLSCWNVDGAYSNLSCTIIIEEGRQKSKRLSYTAKLKCEVIWCTQEKGNHKAAAIFGIDESNVRLWCKHKAAISGCGASRRKFCGPKKKDDFLKLMMQSSRFSRETQDWTVCELWSTSQEGDKEGQIFEHSSKSF